MWFSGTVVSCWISNFSGIPGFSLARRIHLRRFDRGWELTWMGTMLMRMQPLNVRAERSESAAVFSVLCYEVGGPDSDPPVLRDVTYVLERHCMDSMSLPLDRRTPKMYLDGIDLVSMSSTCLCTFASWPNETIFSCKACTEADLSGGCQEQVFFFKQCSGCLGISCSFLYSLKYRVYRHVQTLLLENPQLSTVNVSKFTNQRHTSRKRQTKNIEYCWILCFTVLYCIIVLNCIILYYVLLFLSSDHMQKNLSWSL